MEKLHSVVATSALHDGQRGDNDYTEECLPGTRDKYLSDLSDWAEKGPAERRVQWVYAVAGAGKSAIARSFCAALEQRGFAFASFFAWEGDAQRNTLDPFPATIASQLSQSIPALVPHIEKAINEGPFLLKSTFKKQMDKLVITPLLDAPDAVKENRHVIIVVDGLDELDTKGQKEFLDFIPQFISRLSSLPISLLITSRPESQITGAFNRPNLDFVTSRITIEESRADIFLFLVAKFKEINDAFPYLAKQYGQWPGEEVIMIMVNKSSGFFIWPTIATSYIATIGRGKRHDERLQLVLSSSSVDPWVSNLDVLYHALLKEHAPDFQDPTFHQFKRRLALLCLPVAFDILQLGDTFDKDGGLMHLQWIDMPTCALFGESIDAIWDSMADLASIFAPRVPVIGSQQPPLYNPLLPTIRHRSFRDFVFNLRRSGAFHYCSERELHSEIVSRTIQLFTTELAYKSADFSGAHIRTLNMFLESHLKNALPTEEIGRCMDVVSLEFIPATWPLIAQVFLICTLFCDVYDLASQPASQQTDGFSAFLMHSQEFPQGLQRQEALLAKVRALLHSREAGAPQWDVALLRLTGHDVPFHAMPFLHSIHCWNATLSQCNCAHGARWSLTIRNYREYSTHPVLANVIPERLHDSRQDYLDMLRFFLSIGESSEQAIQLSDFLPVRSDDWILNLLEVCPPDEELYNVLVPMCTAPLRPWPHSGRVEETVRRVETFLQCAHAFTEYAKRCREAGIKINHPPIEIPDQYWRHDKIREHLLEYGYEQSIPTQSSPSSPHSSFKETITDSEQWPDEPLSSQMETKPDLDRPSMRDDSEGVDFRRRDRPVVPEGVSVSAVADTASDITIPQVGPTTSTAVAPSEVNVTAVQTLIPGAAGRGQAAANGGLRSSLKKLLRRR